MAFTTLSSVSANEEKKCLVKSGKGRLSLRPRKALLLQGRHDIELHHGYGAGVVAAVGDDDVGKLLGGLYEFVVHGFEHVAVFGDEHFEGMAALGYVAHDDAQEALVGFGIYVNLQVHLVAQALVVERHNAFDDNHVARLHVNRFGQARAGDIRIGGLLNGPPRLEFLNLVRQKRPLKRIGMVKVGQFAHGQGQFGLVIIIGVLRDDGHGPLGQTLNDFADYGGLSRTRSACDSNN